MLLGEHGRRCKECDLLAAHRGLERRAQRKLGLAEPNVAAQQPVHRLIRLHVCLDLRQRRDLVRRLFIGKGRLELLLPGRVRREGDAGARLAHRVDFQQVFGDVLDDLACAASRARPIGRTKPVESGSPLRPTQILLHSVEVFNRHEELVALRILELQVFAVGAI